METKKFIKLTNVRYNAVVDNGVFTNLKGKYEKQPSTGNILDFLTTKGASCSCLPSLYH